ncbi:MAG: hypothetical protein K2N87_18755 [Eubacterium sp.]|nr:hypothetical protein [Eubacterium sp.]
MNGKELLKSVGEVDERFIHEADAAQLPLSVPDTCKHHTAGQHRRLGAVAACLALLLTVSSTAIAGAKIPKIQEWLAQKWEELTGEQLDDVQQQTIESLSCLIGKSVTKNGTTVTLDSYLSGKERSWVLINVTGIPFSDQSRYYFQKWKIKINGKEAGGSNVISEEVSPDGTLQVLYTHGSPSKANLSLLDPPDLFDTDTWEITLVIDGLYENKGEEQVLVQEGRWKFTFEVPNAKNAETIALPDTVVKEGETASIALTQIRLSETGISLKYVRDIGHVSQDPVVFEKGIWMPVIELPRIELLLKDGRSLETETTNETHMRDEDGTESGEYGAAWKVPVSLEEIAGVRFGETEMMRE